MSKRTYTKEQLENRRLKQIERRAKRTPEQIAIEKEKARIRMKNLRENRTLEEKKEVSIRRSKEYRDSIDSYIVYKHFNDSGDIYIGVGNKYRPNNFTRRSKAWFDTFPETPNVEILGTFKHREIAELFESGLIGIYGLDNLINKIQPIVLYKPL